MSTSALDPQIHDPGRLRVAAVTPGGHRRFHVDDVNALVIPGGEQ